MLSPPPYPGGRERHRLAERGRELFQDLFIFEMANNHQGDVEHGLRIIREVARVVRTHGIKAAIKFQYRDLDTIIHPAYRQRADVPHVPRFLSTALTDEDFRVLVDAARAEGLITMCTPFDEPSVGRLLDHGIQIIKVASCSATDWPLLEEVARARHPIICSTGGKSIYEIDNIVSFFTHRDADFALMHCVATYPTRNEDAQIGFMERLKRRFAYIPVGYSGHESPDNLDIVRVAVAMGASMLERHVGVPTETITLNAYSMSPEQADEWVRAATSVKKIVGHEGPDRRVTQVEIESLNSLARGTFAKRTIRPGETITKDDVFFAMPCQAGQTTSGEYQASMVATREYGEGEPVFERRKPDVINQVRGILHDAKGMLYEAHIEIGTDFTIELSHHFGIEHFRQYGALIVNVINREYCKKLIVVLPGQRHPIHYHKIKEETFQLLWGDLEAELNGVRVDLKPGDKLLIERGAPHGFTTRGGAIFEEISTSHIPGDSYYEEEGIKRDPIQRKTILETW